MNGAKLDSIADLLMSFGYTETAEELRPLSAEMERLRAREADRNETIAALQDVVERLRAERDEAREAARACWCEIPEVRRKENLYRKWNWLRNWLPVSYPLVDEDILDEDKRDCI